ncbi:LysR family transcriptional regulator [Desulfococcaceae bacterium HSG7]|nr:LysR family transcriptional regulator [Desulfococcaceae bacterium HSG7]
MDFNRLKNFYLTAQHASLDKAAAELGVTPQAVAFKIKQLQADYGVKFLDFIQGHLVLTDAGQMLYIIAQEIFDLELQAENRIRGFQRTPHPQKSVSPSTPILQPTPTPQQAEDIIRIHASETFGAYYLPAIINAFKQLNPQIQVAVKVFPLKALVNNTIQENNDLGFIPEYVENDNLLIRELMEDKLAVIVSPNHPLKALPQIKPLNFEGQFLVMHENDPVQHRVIETFVRDKNILLFKHLEFSNYEAIKRAVEDNAGIAIICNKIVNDEVRNGKLAAIPLANQAITQQYYMIRPKDKIISPSIGAFIEVAFKWADSYIQSIPF